MEEIKTAGLDGEQVFAREYGNNEARWRSFSDALPPVGKPVTCKDKKGIMSVYLSEIPTYWETLRKTWDLEYWLEQSEEAEEQAPEAEDFETLTEETAKEANEQLEKIISERSEHAKNHKVDADKYNAAVSEFEFNRICIDIMTLHQKKNHDYGNAFGDTYQDFAKRNQAMADGYAVGLLCNKVGRIKSLVSSEAQVKNESIEDSLIDLASYAIMTLVERRRKESEE